VSTRLSWDRAGSGEALLLLHGIGTTREDSRRCGPRWRPSTTCWPLTYPGTATHPRCRSARLWVWALVVATDGSWLASASIDGEVRLWDPATNTALTSLRVAGGLFHLLLASTTIAVGGERGLYFLALCPGLPSR
jgi:WD40 repeat protein